MSTTKRRITVTLARDDLDALAAIQGALGTRAASAAIRVALREHAAALAARSDRASRLPRAVGYHGTEHGGH